MLTPKYGYKKNFKTQQVKYIAFCHYWFYTIDNNSNSHASAHYKDVLQGIYIAQGKVMNVTSVAVLFNIVASSSITPPVSSFPITNIESIIGMSEEVFLGIEEDLHVSYSEEVYFSTETGYYIKLSDTNNSVRGSMVFEPYNDTYRLVCSYTGDIYPLHENEPDYYVSPFDYLTELPEESTSITKYKAKEKVQTLAASYPDSSKYFNLKDSNGSLNHVLSVHGSSSGGEYKIKNVPNYMNTCFNHYGCVPTTAAMYFAFMYRNRQYTGATDITKGYDLPLLHTDDQATVDEYINYLGNKYFKTNNTGTSLGDIVPGYNSYLWWRGYGSYDCHETTDFGYYANSIKNANPVPISLKTGYDAVSKTYTRHSILGIGYQSIYSSGSGSQTYIIANFAFNDSMPEVKWLLNKNSDTYPTLRSYYPIYK